MRERFGQNTRDSLRARSGEMRSRIHMRCDLDVAWVHTQCDHMRAWPNAIRILPDAWYCTRCKQAESRFLVCSAEPYHVICCVKDMHHSVVDLWYEEMLINMIHACLFYVSIYSGMHDKLKCTACIIYSRNLGNSSFSLIVFLLGCTLGWGVGTWAGISCCWSFPL